MTMQSLYMSDESPEVQFTRQLVARREALLRAQRADPRLARACGRDLVLRVELVRDDGPPRSSGAGCASRAGCRWACCRTRC